MTSLAAVVPENVAVVAVLLIIRMASVGVVWSWASQNQPLFAVKVKAKITVPAMHAPFMTKEPTIFPPSGVWMGHVPVAVGGEPDIPVHGIVLTE
jgi:hypothetical protein